MPDTASHLAHFAGFVHRLHQRPDVSGNRRPAVGRGRLPFYQPAPGTASVPLSNDAGATSWERLGLLLWQTLGYTQVRLYPALQAGQRTGAEAAARRPLASGGARYPVDLHLLVAADAGASLAPCAGQVLAYAPQYHRLFVTGIGASDALPMRSALAIVVSLDFLRTWEKYGDFGYRLSAVDAGLVIGRLHALASCWGRVSVDFDMDGARLDAALGLDSTCQASYCVLHIQPHAGQAADPGVRLDTVRVPPREPVHGSLSRNFLAAHRLAQATPLGRLAGPQPGLPFPGPQTGDVIALPVGRAPTLAQAIAARRSRAHAYTGASLPAQAVHSCIEGMQRRLLGLLADDAAGLEPPRLLVCCLHVVGIKSGLYQVDADTPALVPLEPGDHGAALASAQLLSSFDLQKCSFIVHVCTRRWQSADPHGPRAYRIDQMLAGAALDAGTLAVSEDRVSAHAYLGFDAAMIGRLYGLQHDVNVAAQLCVGVTGAGLELACRILPDCT